MNDYLENLGISFVLTALAGAIKNPDKKASLRRAMLKIATAIQAIYGDDPAFQSLQKSSK